MGDISLGQKADGIGTCLQNLPIEENRSFPGIMIDQLMGIKLFTEFCTLFRIFLRTYINYGTYLRDGEILFHALTPFLGS